MNMLNHIYNNYGVQAYNEFLQNLGVEDAIQLKGGPTSLGGYDGTTKTQDISQGTPGITATSTTGKIN